MAQEQQGFYEYNGNKFYKDKFGSWFVKATGYESLFLSGIKDEGLIQAVHYELNTKPDAKINFQYNDKWYTIWNHEDSTKIKVDRKSEHDNEAPLSNSTYDTTEETKAEANASKGAQVMATQAKAGGFKFSGSNNTNTQASDGKSKYFVDEVKLITITPEEFKKGLKFEAFWNLAKDATQNIMLVKDGDKTEYHILLAHKKAF